MPAVRYLIADDHQVVREGVRTIIEKTRPRWEICGEAVNGQEAIDAAVRLKPDIILMDISMPVMNGLEAASRISALGSTMPILIFTMHESGELAGDARMAGARGYVTKSDATRDLVRAMETLLSGGIFFGHPETPQNEPQRNPGSGMLLRLALAAA